MTDFIQGILIGAGGLFAAELLIAGAVWLFAGIETEEEYDPYEQ